MKRGSYIYISVVVFFVLICFISCISKDTSKSNESTLLESNYWQDLACYIENSDRNFTSNELTRAIELSDKLILINPTNEYCILTRGIFLASIGKTNEAFNDFTKAIRINPYYTDAYLHCADLFLKTDNLDAAFSNIFIALKLEEEYFLSYFYAGLAFLQKDEVKKALECFNIAIQKEPTYSYSHLKRGIIYATLGKTNLAIDDLEHFLEYRSDPDIMNDLAFIYISDAKNKDIDRALTLSEKAVRQAKKPIYLDTLACVYAEKRDFNKAIELEEEAYNLSSNVFYRQMINVFKRELTYLECRKKHPNLLPGLQD